MKLLDDIRETPYRFDVLDVLRQFERAFPDKPRIGDSATLEEEFLLLGQEPYMEFPASNVAGLRQDRHQRYRLLVRYLGLLGPQGALPLSTTEDARQWGDMRDESFARFLDIFNHRFLQLFFRAWADARPVAQRDRPQADRFADYVGTPIGLASPAIQNRDSISDYAKLGLSGLMGPQVKSASRVKSMVAFLFDVGVEVEEFVRCIPRERRRELRFRRFRCPTPRPAFEAQPRSRWARAQACSSVTRTSGVSSTSRRFIACSVVTRKRSSSCSA
jgi:type VI secretion system protein ImpH